METKKCLAIQGEPLRSLDPPMHMQTGIEITMHSHFTFMYLFILQSTCEPVLKTKNSSERRNILVRKKNKGEGPICKICKKSFCFASRLDDHRTVHTQTRNYKCTIDNCGWTYKRFRCWKRHQKDHNYDSIYRCQACNYYSHVKKRLNEHSKLHRHPKK